MTKERRIINSFAKLALDIINGAPKRGKYEYDEYFILVCKKGGSK